MPRATRRPDGATAPAAAPAPPSTTRLDRAAPWIAALAVLACAFALAAFHTRSDDLFMHLAVGRRFFETGSFPHPDPWLGSVTDYDRRWIDLAYWGTHLLFAGLHALGGFALLVFFKALVVVLGAAAPLWLARRLGLRSVLVPAVLLVALWAASDRFIERGSLLSDCIGPWVLALLAAELARPSRLRWLLPPIFLVWTNLHPGVLTGIVFLLAAAVVRWHEWRRWLPLVAACLLASVAHPDGPRHLLWAVQSAPGGGAEVFRKFNVEMMPTFSAEHGGTLEVRLFVALAIVCWLALAAAFWRGSRPWFLVLVLAALTYMGGSTIRYVTTASMAFPVVLAAALAPVPGGAPRPAERVRRDTLLLFATAAAAAIAAGVVGTQGYAPRSGHRTPGFGLDRSAYPFGAADFLKGARPRGAIFNDHSFGAFLAWHWDGDPKLHFHGHMLDARFYAEDFLGISRTPADFDRIVERYDIGAFLMTRYDATPQSGPLVYRLLLTRPDWRLVHWDELAVVFVRNRPGNEALIAEHELRYLDPFRADRMQKGLREHPDRLLAEATQVLRREPASPWMRAFVRNYLRRDPDELLRQP
jgi:hypothetical protein